MSASSAARFAELRAGVAVNGARAPSQIPREAISRAAAETVPSEIVFPSASAIIERIRTSLRLSESATAASNARALPVQFRNEPLFSVTAATGKTTSARSVTALGAISSETTNAFLSAESVSEELSRSSGSIPPTTSALT